MPNAIIEKIANEPDLIVKAWEDNSISYNRCQFVPKLRQMSNAYSTISSDSLPWKLLKMIRSASIKYWQKGITNDIIFYDAGWGFVRIQIKHRH